MEQIQKSNVQLIKTEEVKDKNENIKYILHLKVPYGLLLVNPKYSPTIYPNISTINSQKIQARSIVNQFIFEKEEQQQLIEQVQNLGNNQFKAQINMNNISGENIQKIRQILTSFDEGDITEFQHNFNDVDQQGLDLDTFENDDNFLFSNYTKRQNQTLENSLEFYIQWCSDYANQMRFNYIIQIFPTKQDFLRKYSNSMILKDLINFVQFYSTKVRGLAKNPNEILYRNEDRCYYFDETNNIRPTKLLQPYFTLDQLYNTFYEWKLPFTFNGYPSFTISYMSFIEVYLVRFASLFEGNAKVSSYLDLSTILSMAMSWYTLRFSLMKILDFIMDYPDIPRWKDIIIQMGDSSSGQCFTSPGLNDTLEGIDQLFRICPSKYLIHHGILIIRLNIVLYKQDVKLLEAKKQKTPKEKLNRSSSSLTNENKDLRDYLESIINRADFSKTIEDMNIFQKLPLEDQYKKLGRKFEKKESKPVQSQLARDSKTEQNQQKTESKNQESNNIQSSGQKQIKPK